ncbi:MAG TPA: hypothetical protein PLM07_01890 [Candidatus Rifleibacterium sp.]|nr:hypothetical protein [Candidatus Rifleibacterium sp.]HPT44631.1 hypothetical protein [Candidatus Rifleibacterium sp.]
MQNFSILITAPPPFLLAAFGCIKNNIKNFLDTLQQKWHNNLAMQQGIKNLEIQNLTGVLK